MNSSFEVGSHPEFKRQLTPREPRVAPPRAPRRFPEERDRLRSELIDLEVIVPPQPNLGALDREKLARFEMERVADDVASHRRVLALG